MVDQSERNNRRLYSMLKGYMVEDIFDAAATTQPTFGRGEKLIFDGSGAIYVTAKKQGIQMPSLRTPSDLDIAVYVPKHGFSDNEGPLRKTIDQITNKLGYEHDKGIGADAIYQYGVKKHFSRSEIEGIAASRKDISAKVPREGMDVWLPIQLIPGSRPYLSPLFLREQDHVGLIQPAEMIANKLSLCFDPEQSKPTHLMDVMNLLHATPPLLNLDPSNPENDIELIRCLTVVCLAHNGAPSKDLDMSHLLPTDENVDRLYEAFEARFEHHGTTVKKEYIRTQLEAVSEFAHQVLGGEGAQIALSENETAFLREINNPSHAAVDANIRMDLLQADHPDIFATHPEFEVNAKENDFMLDRIHQNSTRSEVAGIW